MLHNLHHTHKSLKDITKSNQKKEVEAENNPKEKRLEEDKEEEQNQNIQTYW